MCSQMYSLSVTFISQVHSLLGFPLHKETLNSHLGWGNDCESSVSQFSLALLPPPPHSSWCPGPDSLICFFLALSILAQLSAVSVLLISCTATYLSAFNLPNCIGISHLGVYHVYSLCTPYFKFLFLPPPLERRHMGRLPEKCLC